MMEIKPVHSLVMLISFKIGENIEFNHIINELAMKTYLHS